MIVSKYSRASQYRNFRKDEKERKTHESVKISETESGRRGVKSRFDSFHFFKNSRPFSTKSIEGHGCLIKRRQQYFYMNSAVAE